MDFDVRWVAETGSTNADVHQLALAGEPEGVVLVADHQRAGRGRRGRSWQDQPDSSLMLSVLFRPKLAADELGVITTAVALAMAEACGVVCGIEPTLKWPNDLVVEHGKLAGVLAEGVIIDAAVEAVVVGIGVNVNWAENPPDGGVALNHITGGEVDRRALLGAFLDALGGHYDDCGNAEGRRRLRDRYLQRSATVGRRVRVELVEDTLAGTATDVTVAGHLVLQTEEGPVRTITAGDVVHLRPT